VNVIWASEREPDLNRSLYEWASFRIFGHLNGFGPCTTMGVFQGAKIIAVMVFHSLDEKAGVIEISGAAETSRWLTKPVLFEMHAYCFDQLGCQMIVQRNSERNHRDERGLQRMLKSYGYTTTKIPRLYGRDEAGIIHCLTDDDWRANGFHKPLKFSPPEKHSVAA
jgi:RimJ/RimL family protein N-acetyltransferase